MFLDIGLWISGMLYRNTLWLLFELIPSRVILRDTVLICVTVPKPRNSVYTRSVYRSFRHIIDCYWWWWWWWWWLAAEASPRPHWWSLQRSPGSLAGFMGPTSKAPISKGREGKERGGKTPKWSMPGMPLGARNPRTATVYSPGFVGFNMFVSHCFVPVSS